ncbi:MAG: sugar phosphate isomerase/epimerase [Prolixibacteraceae bacterium]|nr:sugar phosphate isomerase/epimerase [Prolixibacteraceae bacterium]MBN2775987.1 sugar phosphate isomerase/epimerase [Prolixibacteraceae bacterium]
METKREFLKKLGLLTVGSMVAGSVSPVLASKSKNSMFAAGKSIGLQIYSVGRELTADVPAGLKKIADIGYKTIELAGYGNRKMGQYSVEEYRKLAEDAGLKITGSHVNPPVRAYTKDNMGEIADFWKVAVEDHVKFGVNTIVQPSLPSVKTIDDAKLVSEVFNKNGEIAKAAGLKWGYHNHNMEFNRVTENADEPAPANPWMKRGEAIYDLFLNNTDPGLVFFEMDVYWAVMGQADPIEYFRKHAGRFPILHIKDRAVLGESGMMNFPKIFEVAYENGLDEFFVELEGIQGMTQFEGVKGCFDYLNNAPFVK